MGMDIEIDGDSDAAVALALLHMIAGAEGKLDEEGALRGVNRSWILGTYAQCIAAVEGELEPAELEDQEDEDEDEDEGPDGAAEEPPPAR